MYVCMLAHARRIYSGSVLRYFENRLKRYVTYDEILQLGYPLPVQSTTSKTLIFYRVISWKLFPLNFIQLLDDTSLSAGETLLRIKIILVERCEYFLLQIYHKVGRKRARSKTLYI